MQLELGFTGLCVFVPDEGSGTVHVLFPAVRDAPDIPRPAIVVDAAYLREGNVACDGTEVRLDLPRAIVTMGSGDGPPALPGGMPFSTNLPADVLGPDAGGALAAHVILRGGTLARTVPHVQWTFSPGAQTLAEEIVWMSGDVDPPLDLALTPLHGAGEPPALPRLFPIDEEIRLRIEGIPAHAVPTPVVPDPLPPKGRRRAASRARPERKSTDAGVKLHVQNYPLDELRGADAHPVGSRDVEQHFTAFYAAIQPEPPEDSPALSGPSAPAPHPGEPRG